MTTAINNGALFETSQNRLEFDWISMHLLRNHPSTVKNRCLHHIGKHCEGSWCFAYQLLFMIYIVQKLPSLFSKVIYLFDRITSVILIFLSVLRKAYITCWWSKNQYQTNCHQLSSTFFDDERFYFHCRANCYLLHWK